LGDERVADKETGCMTLFDQIGCSRCAYLYRHHFLFEIDSSNACESQRAVGFDTSRHAVFILSLLIWVLAFSIAYSISPHSARNKYLSDFGSATNLTPQKQKATREFAAILLFGEVTLFEILFTESWC
jgi:hypothetical protein